MDRLGVPGIRPGFNSAVYKTSDRIEPETPLQRARLQSPVLSFKARLAPFEAMARMLEILGSGAFKTVMYFKGPVVDPTPEAKEGLRVRAVVAQLRALEDQRVPFGGLVAKVRYRRDASVLATVKVGRGLPTKVSVRVRGAPFRADWRTVVALAKERMEDIDQE